MYEIRVPRNLLGDHISALRDCMHLLRRTEDILVFYTNEERLRNARENLDSEEKEEQIDESMSNQEGM